MPEKYKPSNGTGLEHFVSRFCERCSNEKFMHTQAHGDRQCDIFNRAFLLEVNDPKYPEEWTYNENDVPVCTAHKPWDWGDKDNLNNPPPEVFIDPNQLKLF